MPVYYELLGDRSTFLDIPHEVTSKDNVKFKIKIQTTFSLIINIKVTSENASPVYNSLRIQFRNGSSNKVEQFLVEEGKLIQELSSVEEGVLIPRCFIFFKEYEYVGDNTLGEARFKIYRAKHNSIKIIKGSYAAEQNSMKFIKRNLIIGPEGVNESV